MSVGEQQLVTVLSLPHGHTQSSLPEAAPFWRAAHRSAFSSEGELFLEETQGWWFWYSWASPWGEALEGDCENRLRGSAGSPFISEKRMVRISSRH